MSDRDTEIERVTVGGTPLHNASIEVVEYDPRWPSLFDLEAGRIRHALGARCMVLEHVGSTSVPGLSAKPIIDMVLEVPDSADEPAYVPDLEAAGYVLRIREPEWFEHRVFKGPEVNVNLHVFSDGCSETTRMVLFRDHLRGDDTDRELYQRTKRAAGASAPGSTCSTMPTPSPSVVAEHHGPGRGSDGVVCPPWTRRKFNAGSTTT